MWFISLVFKNVWRRKLRSALTGTSMAIAVCAVIAMLGTAEGYEQSLAGLYEARSVDIVIVRAGVQQRVASFLDQKLIERFRLVEGVHAVDYSLIDLIEVEGIPAIYVFGMDPDSILMEDTEKAEGRRITAKDRRKAMVGEALAQRLKKKVADSIEVEGEPFEIVSVFQSYNMLERNGIVVPISELQEIMGQPGKVTTFLVILKKTHKAPEVVEKIRKEIETMRDPKGNTLNLDVKTARDHVKTNFETRIFKGLAWASSMIAMIIGFVGMFNTMMMSITERIREIATFRALGWRKYRVMQMIFLEALTLSTIGALVGMALAIPLMELLSSTSATSTIVNNRLTPEIIGKGVGMGLSAGLLGAIYPAWIAAQLSPATALRHE